MLSLDSVKTRTIYSKPEIHSLNLELKDKLKEAYTEGTPEAIARAMSIIRMLYYLAKVPHLIKELNDISNIQMVALLEILFMKCSQWPDKDDVQCWAGTLMAELAHIVPQYPYKPQILARQIPQALRTQHVQFFATHLADVFRFGNLESMGVAVAFLRVYLIDLLQNKKVEPKLAEEGQISKDWKQINSNLIKIASSLQNVMGEEICISISYWLCSVKKQFIKECVLQGIVNFLCQSLANKGITEWYGKKIIAFLKLLLLDGSIKEQHFSVSEFESCVARFTIKYDNESIIQQARSLFAHLGNSEGKIEKHQASYRKYIQAKDPKSLWSATEDLRVLLLYAEEPVLRSELQEEQNERSWLLLIKKEEALALLNEIFNLVAYNYKYKGEKAQNFSEAILRKLGAILDSSSYKQELVASKKKMLISIIRMLKQILQNRQKKTHIAALLKTNSIIKKLTKFSDCTNFRYERELFSLINALSNDSAPTSPSKNKEKGDLAQVMKALVKHLNEEGYKAGKSIEDELEEVQLFYEMILRGEVSSIKEETIHAVVKKIKVSVGETEDVQISILGSSDAERTREIANQINYYAIKSLQILEKTEETAQKFPLTNPEIDRIIALGLLTEDLEVLKSITSYLAELLESDQLSKEQVQKVKQIYRRYQQRLGEDSEIVISDLGKVGQPPTQEDILTLVETLKGEANEGTLAKIQSRLLTVENESIINQILNKFSEFGSFLSPGHALVFLRFLYRASQIEALKKTIFGKFSQRLLGMLTSTELQPSEITNLVYKILGELFYENYAESTAGFFQNLLQISYGHFTKQSLEFTDLCLEKMKYSGDEIRKQKYWNAIYNDPDGIGREAAIIIRADAESEQKFWALFKKEIETRVLEEKKMALHFIQEYGKNASNDSWKKYELSHLLQACCSALVTREEEVLSKGPSEVTIKRLIRLSNGVSSIHQNETIEIGECLKDSYSMTTNTLLTHPRIDGASKVSAISEKFVLGLTQILKQVVRNREAYPIIKQNLNTIDSISEKVSEYRNPHMNEMMLEIYRILLLRDEDGDNFSNLFKVFEDYKARLSEIVSPQGSEHSEACDRIAAAVLNKNPLKFKDEYFRYFFPQMYEKQVEKQLLSFSDAELLKHLKNLLSPPYQYGLHLLSRHLRLVQSPDFSNTLVRVFLNSSALCRENEEDRTCSEEEVQEKIISSIWAEGCQLGPEFYRLMSLNVRGLRLCLRTKKIGLEGVKIVCGKFFEYPEEVPLCAQILHLNVHIAKEWTPVSDSKIPALINKQYASKIQQFDYVRCVGNLIGSSSKLKAIQNQYQMQDNLVKNMELFLRDGETLCSLLYAASGLVYLHEKNQEKLGGQNQIKQYLKILLEHRDNVEVFEKVCNLLSNLVFKNQKLVKTFSSLKVEEQIIGVVKSLQYEEKAVKQFLRLVGNMSTNLESATLIVRADFLKVWSACLAQAEARNHDHIIKYAFDILFNLLNFNEIEAKNIAYKCYEAGCSQKIISYMHKNALNSDIIISGLDALEKLFILDVARVQSLEYGVLACLEDIAKVQSWNENVLDRWVRVVYSLFKHPDCLSALLASEILSKCALFLRNHPDLKPQTLLLLTQFADLVHKKASFKVLAGSGYIEFLVQLLRVKKLKTALVSNILSIFTKAHEEGMLQSPSYVKIFEGLIQRLEIEFRDENAQRIITLLTMIREKVIINTKAASILLEFGYMFLTQKELITSLKYHKRVREFICLLSYFVAFAIELKLIFREEGFIEILESWIRIDKSLDEDNSVSEACRVCIFTIQNEQRFLVNIGENMTEGTPFYSKLQKGRKCLLYRRNHTNKNAIIKLLAIPKKVPELISFKAPDGQIKEKYTLPLTDVIGIRDFSEEGDPIFKSSVFNSPGGLFQKDALARNCVSIVGMVGEELSIRQLDVEFIKVEEKQEFLENLKAGISIQFKERKSGF